MQEIAGVGITVATILAGTFFSSQSINGLRSEMNNLRSEIMGRPDSIPKDMRDLYAEQARHDLRITNLEQHQK